MPQVSLNQLVEALTASALVCFPTDTVPALAARPEQAALIYQAKGRSLEKPLILMGASLEDLRPYVVGDAAAQVAWEAIAQKYWPGQLTLVLPASTQAPPTLNPLNTGTLGIRVPDHPVALELLARTGPLATTSANLSGQPPLTQLSEIARTFPTALTLPAEAFDNQSSVHISGKPSTVAQWVEKGSEWRREKAAGGSTISQIDSSQWKILRQGTISL